MDCILKVGVLAVSLLVTLWTAQAEACHRWTRQGCSPNYSQPATMDNQSAAAVSRALRGRPFTTSDCQDNNGNPLQKGWYWQAYYFSTNTIVKKGPFPDEATCKRNMDMTCPSSDCCPARDPYFCPGRDGGK